MCSNKCGTTVQPIAIQLISNKRDILVDMENRYQQISTYGNSIYCKGFEQKCHKKALRRTVDEIKKKKENDILCKSFENNGRWRYLLVY